MFGIDDAVAAGSKLIDDVVTRIWPDATEVEKAKISQVTEQAKLEMATVLGQLEINKIEAGSNNWLTSGWRPFVGWVCGFALAYSAIIDPFLRFVAAVIFGYTGVFPVIDTTITLQVLLGMLGFGAFRTFDKVKGTVK